MKSLFLSSPIFLSFLLIEKKREDKEEERRRDMREEMRERRKKEYFFGFSYLCIDLVKIGMVAKTAKWAILRRPGCNCFF